MSMLAEKRSKQKWLLNPQGKHWLADSNKFGLKILESMGWKEGKGLGKQQDGITKPVRIAYKNDNKGLGLKETASSMQQDHFNALLKSLNKDKTPKTKKIVSLEEKSQNSRTRVHYKKFTRGKDISRYTSKDIASILENKISSVDDVPIDKPTCEINTINKGSMNDYFSNKMPSGLKLQTETDSDEDRCFGFGFSKEQGLTNPAFEPLKSTFTFTNKHILDTISEEPESLNESPDILARSNQKCDKKTENALPHKVKKRKKNKNCSHAVEEVDVSHKKTCKKPALKDCGDLAKSNDCGSKDVKVKKRKKGIDNPALQISPSESPEEKFIKRKKTKGIDNPALDLDLIMNVVREPVPVPKTKSSKKKGFDNYGFDIKAQRVEEKANSISKSLETYQAEVENDINQIKDVPFNDEELYVGEFSNSDGENQKQKDGVLLRYKYASFTKDPHWTAKYNQTANLAKKSYKHLIKGDIAVAFKESNLHEIKGYGLGNKM